jgi:hypothetical protein
MKNEIVSRLAIIIGWLIATFIAFFVFPPMFTKKKPFGRKFRIFLWVLGIFLTLLGLFGVFMFSVIVGGSLLLNNQNVPGVWIIVLSVILLIMSLGLTALGIFAILSAKTGKSVLTRLEQRWQARGRKNVLKRTHKK